MHVQRGNTEKEVVLWQHKVLETLIGLLVKGGEKVKDCPVNAERTFDYQTLYRETACF
ncbi:MAG: hypothetical protein OS130_01855 [Thermodesulfobacteriota bacterium]|jgi:hypothetical protein|nr:MAG: hypothetical protein OS130_01855 [Thermodesulfobacteriota bacterium]